MSQSCTYLLTTPDEVDLFVYCWLPEAEARGVVQIAHGLAEHAGRYERLAAALNAAGFAVYANDHRGHGRTAKSPEELGFFAESGGWRKCVDDLWLIYGHAVANHPRLPFFLLGHSMGATLAEQFMGESSLDNPSDQLAGVVLSGANGTPTALATLGIAITRAERLRLGPKGKSKLVQALTFDAFNKKFSPTRTSFDWLSRDQAEVDQYVADPLCGFPASVQLWIDLLEGWRAVSTPEHRSKIPRNVPLYVISGSRDPVSGNTRQLESWLTAYRSIERAAVEHRFYPEARHELFNETNRDEVTRDLIAWMNWNLRRS